MIEDEKIERTWPASSWQQQQTAPGGDFEMAASSQFDIGLGASTTQEPISTPFDFDFEMANLSTGPFDSGPLDPSFAFTHATPSRPSLALDTGFAPPADAYGQISSLPTDTSASASVFEAEQLETPYSFGVEFSRNLFDRGAPTAPMTISQQPEQPTAFFTQEYQSAPPTQPHTISPEHLPHQHLRPNKSFGDIMMESRGSSSSGDAWQPQPLPDWLPEPPSQNRPLSALDEIKREHYDSMKHEPEEDMKGEDGKVDKNKVAKQVRAYLNAPNRLGHGERSIIVMTPKVAQKSYGTEKRYLCPQPQAVFIGKTWWTRTSGPCPAAAMAPPIVNISLAGEDSPPDVFASWTAATGEDLTERISHDRIRNSENPVLGKAAGKNLHISNSHDKRRRVTANVSVKIPQRAITAPDRNGKVEMAPTSQLGIFESKEIKVISKPSKKRTNSSKAAAGSADLNVSHGSTISLFNRVRAQTSSTRYLSVEPQLDAATGSDGQPFPGVATSFHARKGLEALTADPMIWESFIIWLVDASRSPKGWAPPMQAGYPSTPVNAILGSFTQPICYNTTVVLQSLTTGIVTPTLIVRRVEQASRAFGADGQGEAKRYCPPGEFMGEPVSQLHKVALEIYNPSDTDVLQREPRYGGEWLSCQNERILAKVASRDRQWTTRTDRRASGSQSNTPSSRNIPLPSSEYGIVTPPTPGSSGSSLGATGDYFSRRPSTTSLQPSPVKGDVPLPSDGGPVRRQRAQSSSKGPLGSRPVSRKRSAADTSAEATVTSAPSLPMKSWAVDVTDVSVWSIVSAEQSTYTFFVPSGVQELSEPITPIAHLSRYIPPGQAAEVTADEHNHYTTLALVPLITYYGHGFRKSKDGLPVHRIYYGDEEASHHEFRCGEVIAASEPADLLRSKPVTLVRHDGECIFPTDLTYPRERHLY